MDKFLIRFNKSRGNHGRGTVDHVWRVFKGNQEYLFKHLNISVPCHDETSKDDNGNTDWNICCYGILNIDKETSTAIITKESDGDTQFKENI